MVQPTQGEEEGAGQREGMEEEREMGKGVGFGGFYSWEMGQKAKGFCLYALIQIGLSIWVVCMILNF